jgi:tetratricopeptide (TPR) repeat protein
MSPAALVCILTSLALSLAFAPAVSAQQPAGQLDASPALFTVLAALNAAGFDEGLQSPNTHPLRRQMITWVEQRKPPSLDKIRDFITERRASDPAIEFSRYVTLALSTSGPPAFKPRFGPNLMPPETLPLEGLLPLLARFYREAEIEDAFQRAQPWLDQVIAQYHEPVTNAILEANSYLRNPTSGLRGRRFQIFIELLAPPNIVISRLLGDDFFVIVTPSPRPRVRDIRHAYLDHLIDPLTIRYSAALDAKKPLADLALGSPLLAEEYKNDFSRLAAKSAVYAVEARLAGSQGSALVQQAMREGFILTAAFYDALPAYEKQEESFALYFRKMIESIDLAREDRRIAQIEFASAPSVRKVETPAAPPLSPAEKDLDEAEKLYQAHDLDAAAVIFRRVYASDAAPPLKARAAYGLGRIAAQQKNLDLSQQWFERTLELNPEPFERAWALVYLGRLARAARDPELAMRRYQAALAVEGASDAARKAAQSELAQVAAQLQPPEAP